MLVYLSYVDVYKFLSCAVAMQNRFSLALEMDFNFVFCCYTNSVILSSLQFIFFLAPTLFSGNAYLYVCL